MARKKNKQKGKRSRKKAPEKAPPAATEDEAVASTGSAEVADDEISVIDLDADDVPVVDLAAGGASDEAIEQLIAETLATAEAELAPGEPVEASPSAATENATDRPVVAERSADGDTEAAEAAIRALIDLGPISSPEVRDRLLAEALAHAEHQDARYRVPFSQTPTAGRWKALLASVIVLVAGAVAAVPPGWVRPDPPAQLGAAERASHLRVALLLQAQQVEAFRVRAQRLPASLDEVTRTLPGVRYVRSGSRGYQLVAYEANGNAIVYDSTRPTAPFGALAPSWASPP